MPRSVTTQNPPHADPPDAVPAEPIASQEATGASCASPAVRETLGAPRRGLTRRAFLFRCSAITGGAIVTAGTGLYARYVEPYWPTIERRNMDIPRLHPSLAGLRLVQLSDLHLYSDMPADYLQRQLERSVALAPDLIVLTGDYITRGDLRYRADLARILRVLHAPLGVFAVLGNHDCGAHQGRARVGSPALANYFETTLADAGITVLRNASRRVSVGAGQLQLVGVDDLWSGFSDPQLAFADVTSDVPCIALAHNPDAIDDLKDKPCDWILSGHTHGGQVRIPFFGALVLPVRHREYDAGLFRVGSQRLYVNRGLGNILPIRFNCRPEITLFDLSRRA